jgi:hypothetical protein
MTQPDYVPIRAGDRVRPAERLPPARPWRADRPGDLQSPDLPQGRRLGHQGSDLGYGIKLARRFIDKLHLAEGESVDDAVAGCFAVGTKRSSMLGRAPVIYDFELAYRLWGFLNRAPADLVEFRKPLFQECSHDYDRQRDIADRVPDSTLQMSPADVAAQLSDWRRLIVTT